MWVIARFRATAFFSLRLSEATSSGGKTLIVPTPYAVKMALIDSGIRLWGTPWVKRAWEWLAPMTIAVRGACRVVVNKTFVRLLRESRDRLEVVGADGSTVRATPFARTVGFREYVYLQGPFALAFQVVEAEASVRQELRQLLPTITYLGKRGGFVQFIGLTESPDFTPKLCQGWSQPLEEVRRLSDEYLVLPLDDFGPGATFGKLSTFSPEKARLGKERIFRMTLLPYRRIRTSRSFELYELVVAGERSALSCE